MIYYILSFFVSFIACFLFNYPVRILAERLQFLDIPDERKLHKKAVPYGGGVGLYLSLVTGFVLVNYMYPPAFIFNREVTGLIIGGLLTLLLGLWDDLRGSGALLKFTCEAVIAILMYGYGFRIERLSVPGVGTVELGWLGLFITIFWFWIMMNAINLIDGLDGLAAGVTGISAMTILVITIEKGQPFETFMALIVAGICLGFLPHNFHPARLFMGDAGSLTLGFLLACLTLTTSTKAPAVLTLLIPFLAVGMPVFDTTHAFLRRILSGQHPFRADKRHLHHRLLDLGLSQRRAVLLLYYISAYLGVMAYILSKTSAQITFIVVVLLMGGLLLLTENITLLAKKNSGVQAGQK
jgi:UDP-GlcNAc:undecaprenyl-phosphate GlcNAc-1-phosphate transferase